MSFLGRNSSLGPAHRCFRFSVHAPSSTKATYFRFLCAKTYLTEYAFFRIASSQQLTRGSRTHTPRPFVYLSPSPSPSWPCALQRQEALPLTRRRPVDPVVATSALHYPPQPIHAQISTAPCRRSDRLTGGDALASPSCPVATVPISPLCPLSLCRTWMRDKERCVVPPEMCRSAILSCRAHEKS